MRICAALLLSAACFLLLDTPAFARAVSITNYSTKMTIGFYLVPGPDDSFLQKQIGMGRIPSYRRGFGPGTIINVKDGNGVAVYKMNGASPGPLLFVSYFPNKKAYDEFIPPGFDKAAHERDVFGQRRVDDENGLVYEIFIKDPPPGTPKLVVTEARYKRMSILADQNKASTRECVYFELIYRMEEARKAAGLQPLPRYSHEVAKFSVAHTQSFASKRLAWTVPNLHHDLGTRLQNARKALNLDPNGGGVEIVGRQRNDSRLKDGGRNPAEAMRRWFASEAHKGAILGNWRTYGIGVSSNNEATFYTIIFLH